MPPLEHNRSSFRALDALAFFLADVSDGLGPFLAIYLTTTLDWSSGQAGTALAAMLVGTILAQTFMGALIDRIRHKTFLIAAASLAVGCTTLAMFWLSDANFIFLSQFLIGVLVTVFPPAIAAISLGLVGFDRLHQRVARNECFNHGGNVFAALVTAFMAHWFGASGVFYAMASMSLACALSAIMIRSGQIDYRLARGASLQSDPMYVEPIGVTLRRSGLAVFGLAVILFHFANAAMLPLVGQKIGESVGESASTWMAICIVVAQAVMVPIAFLAGKYLPRVGAWTIFLVGFSVLPIRGFLYTLTENPILLSMIQILDGVGAAIYGVCAVVVVSQLTKGSGRFNFVQGLLATSVGIGAAASNAISGMIVDRFGYNYGFWFLTLVALLALAVLLAFVRIPRVHSEIAQT